MQRHGSLREVKDEYRDEVRRELVAAARRLVAAHGPGGLTMKRLAETFGASIGTIYRHFASKDALLAEVDAAELADLASAARFAARSADDQLDPSSLPLAVRSLARVLAAGRFWIDASTSAPQQLRKARHLMGDPTVPPATRSLATTELLAPLVDALDDAVAAGALHPGDAGTRASLIVSVIPIPTCAPHLWDAPASDPDLSQRLLDCLLEAWAVAPADLDAAKRLIAIPR